MNGHDFHVALWLWFGMSLVCWIVLKTHRYRWPGKVITYFGRVGMLALLLLVLTKPSVGFYVVSSVDEDMPPIQQTQSSLHAPQTQQPLSFYLGPAVTPPDHNNYRVDVFCFQF